MNAKSIFAEALARTDPTERAAFLEQACGGDVALRQRVEALLRSHEQAGSFLDKPAAEETSDVAPGQWLDPNKLSETPLEGVGSRIGPYKLLQQIGEGGMGVVFMAEQQEPVRRMVALKVIKAGMDSAQVIARFEAERQALALMDHPNIAKVFDAGTTASGRPFFVMELVKGIPITKYCDEQRLSPKQRLELFVPVCQAIQHAHQKGIIHRDIKPSNVLIAAYDGKPAPKVIDFGVAKATGGKLTERTLFTGLGGLVGTFEYMSPEQAEFNALDIDTRSDIYSLGVLLYELLTGSTPLSRQRIKDAALMEVLRLIREEEPPKPSTRLSESKDSLASVSAQRHTEPAALLKAIRGEVDWIVMKALEKDRSRRYETANGLARDIQRYLSEEPVEAGPPSATYRLRKLAWKHRRSLGTAAALLLVLLLGAAISIWQGVRATQAEREAREQAIAAEEAQLSEANQREEAEEQKAAAEAERNRALQAEKQAKVAQSRAEQSEQNQRAVLAFLLDKVLAAARPKGQEGGLGPQVTIRQAIDAAEPSIGPSFANQPEVEAEIRYALGMTYHYLAENSLAIGQHARALSLREAKLGPDHPDTFVLRHELAHAYLKAGRPTEAMPLFERALKQMEAKWGLDDPNTITCRSNLGNAYNAVGRNAEAIRLHTRNLKLSEDKLGAAHYATLGSRNDLAIAYHSTGRHTDAIALHEKNLEYFKVNLGPDNFYTLMSSFNLALAYRAVGKLDRSILLLEETLGRQKATLGPEHPHTVKSLSAFGDTLGQMAILGHNLLCQHKFAEAESLLRACLKVREAKQPDDWATFNTQSLLGGALLGQKKYTDAEPLLLKGYEGMKKREAKTPPPSKVRLTESLERLVQLYEATGKKDEAEKWRKQREQNSKANAKNADKK